MLNKGTRHVCRSEMTNKDESFWTFFDVRMLFYIETDEKSKHFSYPDYFTYPVSQHGRHGQRCPDNRGCAVELTTSKLCRRDRVRTSFRIGVTPKSGNSYPRSRHAEPDVQVTLRTLYLLHNAPAQQGRERRNGWFSV